MAKQKRCRNCKELFSPRSSLQIACCVLCASAIAKKKIARDKAKIERERKRETRKRKEAIKSRGDWVKEAQREFNRYIRIRDRDEPCISCQRFHNGQYHAGHYRTTGSHPELRFNEDNCHKQCAPCNNHKSGDITNYRINLLIKIGEEAVEMLEGNHPPASLSIEDLKKIKRKYRDLANDLEKKYGCR